MIRAWLSTARRRPPARLVDAAVVVTAQIDVRDGQIEGLRDALAEAQQRLALCQRELATYKTRDWLLLAAACRARLADDRTAEVTAHQLSRSRPMAAPTEQYRRPR